MLLWLKVAQDPMATPVWPVSSYRSSLDRVFQLGKKCPCHFLFLPSLAKGHLGAGFQRLTLLTLRDGPCGQSGAVALCSLYDDILNIFPFKSIDFLNMGPSS